MEGLRMGEVVNGGVHGLDNGGASGRVTSPMPILMSLMSGWAAEKSAVRWAMSLKR